MKKPVLHPDQLTPGDMVGPWLITRVLGEGGSSRVFKVERDGQPYSLKCEPWGPTYQKKQGPQPPTACPVLFSADECPFWFVRRPSWARGSHSRSL